MVWQAQKASRVYGHCRLLAAGGLVALALLLAGAGLRHGIAQAPDQKPDPKKDVRPMDEQTENELLLDYARNLRFLLNDLRRDNFENPYGIYRPAQPPVMVPLSTCLPTSLGASVETLTPAMADQLDLKREVGLIVCRVADGTPAAKAGLRPHDVLLEVNGKDVPANVGLFLKLLDGFKVDTPFDAVILRKGKKETLKGLTVPGAKARSDVGRPDPTVVADRPEVDDPHALARAVAAATAPVAAGRIRAAPPMVVVQTTSLRAGYRFTTGCQDGSLLINVTGTVADGKSTVAAVTVRDAAGTATYAAVDQVPQKYRAKVESLVALNELGDLHVTLRKK